MKKLLILVFVLLLIAPAAALAVGGTFTDDDDSVFEADIEWLASAGVTLGCNPPTNDNFCPDDNVKRGQMAAFMRRFAAYLGAEDGIVSEADNAATADSATTATSADTAATATSADTAAMADDAEMLDGISSEGFVQKDEADSVSTAMIEDGAVTTAKVAPAGFEVGGDFSPSTVPGLFEAATDTPVCVAGPYTPETDQVALMFSYLSVSAATSENLTSMPLLSNDGGTTWSRAFWGFFAPDSNPAGGYALSSRVDQMNLTAGTTYSFAIGYQSLGADYAATDGRCHLAVTFVSSGGGGTFGTTGTTEPIADNASD